MKKAFLVSALVLVLLIVFTGCENELTSADSSKFEGMWERTGPTGVVHSFTFTGNTMLYKNSDGISRPGTFAFTDTEITFIPRSANTWKGYTQGYSLSGDILTLLPLADNSQAFGDFTRK